MRPSIRGMVLTIVGEGVAIIAACVARARIVTLNSTLVMIVWAALFAGFVGLIVSLVGARLKSTTSLWFSLRALGSSLALSMVFYFVAWIVTGSMIAALTFPLFLIFFAGASFALVSLYSNGGIRSGAMSLVAVLFIGMAVSVAPYVATRRTSMHIAVVKYTARSTSQTQITASPGIEIEEFDRSALLNLNLRGTFEVSRTFSLGPKSTNISHMIVIMTHELHQDAELSEPASNVIYVQDGNHWQKIPADSRTTFRTLQLSPISGQCTVVSVWHALGDYRGVGGPCWNARED